MKHRVARRSDLSAEEGTAVSVQGRQIGLYLVGDRVCAVSNVCTHQNVLLTDGFFEDGCIECPLHEGRFSVETGAVLGGPPLQPLGVYAVSVENDDVYVDVG